MKVHRDSNNTLLIILIIILLLIISGGAFGYFIHQNKNKSDDKEVKPKSRSKKSETETRPTDDPSKSLKAKKDKKAAKKERDLLETKYKKAVDALNEKYKEKMDEYNAKAEKDNNDMKAKMEEIAAHNARLLNTREATERRNAEAKQQELIDQFNQFSKQREDQLAKYKAQKDAEVAQLKEAQVEIGKKYEQRMKKQKQDADEVEKLQENFNNTLAQQENAAQEYIRKLLEYQEKEKQNMMQRYVIEMEKMREAQNRPNPAVGAPPNPQIRYQIHQNAISYHPQGTNVAPGYKIPNLPQHLEPKPVFKAPEYERISEPREKEEESTSSGLVMEPIDTKHCTEFEGAQYIQYVNKLITKKWLVAIDSDNIDNVMKVHLDAIAIFLRFVNLNKINLSPDTQVVIMKLYKKRIESICKFVETDKLSTLYNKRRSIEDVFGGSIENFPLPFYEIAEETIRIIVPPTFMNHCMADYPFMNAMKRAKDDILGVLGKRMLGNRKPNFIKARKLIVWNITLTIKSYACLGLKEGAHEIANKANELFMQVDGDQYFNIPDYAFFTQTVTNIFKNKE
ncbi:hypothetical protein ECANGB1_1253 [Enterospora canceri]|uniref:Uncharacterized protein n=1 Tax=Enterospora canceri TaxID=1081671 RepID=A0A1Y1S6H2_9MICR|nr:hypothetical protein ECANGB1_1253 [Enterospora canceri]